VFGNERTGLPVELASRCHRVVRLPTPGWVDSFNLASSVAVMLALLTEAARAAPAPRASTAARLRLRDTFEDALTRRGFYKGRGPASFRPRLDELLGKMDFSERDVEVVRDLVIALAGRPDAG
jgi:tRNA C32,U32 (ribose-2'-O)-methylase TrmJ